VAIELRRPRVVLNLVTGKTIIGERLWSWPWQYRLKAAAVVEPGAEPVAADGVVVVPRRAVEFAQITD
jgi:hypothetical protein